MKCDSEKLTACALSILDDAQTKAVEEHAKTCRSCARELARLREMAALLATLPEAEGEPIDTEELWSEAVAQRQVNSRPARIWDRVRPQRRWAVGLAAAACLVVLSFHYGVTVQVGELKISFGNRERSTPEAAALNEELVRHLAGYDELSARIERTLLGLAHAVNDLDTRHRRELIGLRNEIAVQRELDQSAIRKSFKFVANEMTDALRPQP